MPPPLPPLPPPPLSPVVGRMWAQVTEYVGASDRKRVGASDRERVGASDGATERTALHGATEEEANEHMTQSLLANFGEAAAPRDDVR